MKLIDIHAHLTFKSFKKDLDNVIKKAKEAGLIAIINSSIDSEDFRKSLMLKQKFPDLIFLTIGAAPQMLSKHKFDDLFNIIEKHLQEAVAIGEIGLDYYWVKDRNEREFTKKAFEELANLAVNYNKPIVIHNREATKDVISILREVEAEKVVFHAFMGNLEEALEIISKGWYISIPTIIARSDKHKQIVRHIDLDHIMLETDSPFLAPWPKTRNEPANVKVSAQIIANLKHVSAEKVAEKTTYNSIKFFKLPLNFN